MLLKVISQSNNEDLSNQIITETINDFRVIGDRQFVYPSMLWMDGNTYTVADKGYLLYSNQIQLIQYNHNYGWFSYEDVGNGTDTPDPNNHPVAFVRTESGNVYTGQTNPHNSEINCFKMNVPSNIQNGTTQITSIGDDEAYPQVFTDLNNKTVFCVRDYLSTGTHHDLAVLVSDGGIEGTFTKTVITYNDSNMDDYPDNWYRHYHSSPILYGIQTVHYLFTSLRNDNDNEYFMHGVCKSSDWDNFSNYNETHSDQISVDGRISLSDWETYYVFNGSTANDQTNLNPCTSIQVNDTAYVIYKDETTELYQIGKFNGTDFTSNLLEIDNLDHTQFYTPFMYWNGTNIVVSCICNDGGTYTKELWGISTDFETHTRKYSYENPTTVIRPILLPENLDNINGQYMAYLDQDGDDVNFLLTIDKFRL